MVGYGPLNWGKKANRWETDDESGSETRGPGIENRHMAAGRGVNCSHVWLKGSWKYGPKALRARRTLSGTTKQRFTSFPRRRRPSGKSRSSEGAFGRVLEHKTPGRR